MRAKDGNKVGLLFHLSLFHLSPVLLSQIRGSKVFALSATNQL